MKLLGIFVIFITCNCLAPIANAQTSDLIQLDPSNPVVTELGPYINLRPPNETEIFYISWCRSYSAYRQLQKITQRCQRLGGPIEQCICNGLINERRELAFECGVRSEAYRDTEDYILRLCSLNVLEELLVRTF